MNYELITLQSVVASGIANALENVNRFNGQATVLNSLTVKVKCEPRIGWVAVSTAKLTAFSVYTEQDLERAQGVNDMSTAFDIGASDLLL